MSDRQDQDAKEQATMESTTLSPVKVWAGQIRAPFLLLSLMLALIGGAAAHQQGQFLLFPFLLAAVGVTLAHVAVNLFNEISDHKTGIDARTKRTPFSGGSGTLQAGLTTSRAVAAVAWTTLLLALAIGIYLAHRSGWLLLVFALVGGVSSVFYTTHFARWMIGELMAGLSLGSLVVLGTYYAITGTLTPAVVWLSVPPGILTALLLLLNEFPDAEADRAGGRRHLVIVLGWRGAAAVYVAALTACYAILVGGVLLGLFPAAVLLALLTLPLAAKASLGALRDGGRPERLVPALGANVGLVLGTDLLLALAYFVA